LNSKSKEILIFGAVVVVLMLLFPPWDYFDPDTSARRSAGYHFLLRPPEPLPVKDVFGPPRYPHMVRVRKNDISLIFQLLITVSTALGLALLFRNNRSLTSIFLGIVFLVFAAFVIGFVIWIVVTEKLQYGHWALP